MEHKYELQKMASNPWLHIPLEDYERHMSHKTVGQSALLNVLTKKYLDKVTPETALFPGVSGGNGLEHIDPHITKQVYGVDINADYLAIASLRYQRSIPSLQLLNFDITNHTDQICKVDFIWAALVLEYTGIDQALAFFSNNIRHDGHLLISIQSNHQQPPVSSTGIESIKKAGEIFALVDPGQLLNKTSESGFKLIEKEENFLINGKSIITFHFVKAT